MLHAAPTFLQQRTHTHHYHHQPRRPAGILEAWAGMFNGLSKDKAEQYLKPFAPPLLDFVEAVYSDKAGQDDGAPPGWRAGPPGGSFGAWGAPHLLDLPSLWQAASMGAAHPWAPPVRRQTSWGAQQWTPHPTRLPSPPTPRPSPPPPPPPLPLGRRRVEGLCRAAGRRGVHAVSSGRAVPAEAVRAALPAAAGAGLYHRRHRQLGQPDDSESAARLSRRAASCCSGPACRWLAVTCFPLGLLQQAAQRLRHDCIAAAGCGPASWRRPGFARDPGFEGHSPHLPLSLLFHLSSLSLLPLVVIPLPRTVA